MKNNDIKERLRVADVGEAFIGQHGVELVQTELGLEAADRIEALEGEVALLKTERTMREDWISRQSTTLKKVFAREARLRAALQDVVDAYDFVIVDECDRGWSSVSDAVEAARKAIRAAAGEENNS
jgi:hypothetical protein